MRDQRMFGIGDFTGEKIAQLPPVAQLLFFGCVAISNDLGQFKANAFELRVRIWPWGLVPLEVVKEAFDLCKEADVFVEFSDDCYFIPGWFKRQGGLQYYAKSKLPSIPKDLLDKYPSYRDAMLEASGRSSVARKNAQRRNTKKSRAGRLDLDDPDKMSDVLQIEAMADESEDAAMKIEAVQRMANSVQEHVTADQMREYLEVLDDISHDKVMAAASQLKREKNYMCFPPVIRQKVFDMFGEPRKTTQRERDADEIIKALSKGHGSYNKTLKTIPSKRQGPAIIDVWERMESMSPRPLPSIVGEIYGDTEYSPARVSNVWKAVTRELKDG